MLNQALWNAKLPTIEELTTVNKQPSNYTAHVRQAKYRVAGNFVT